MRHEKNRNKNTSMNSVRACQNCHTQFVIESEDFDFYKKVKVPPPTFCFLCRVQRRMAFRNERTLYKRKCDAPGHEEQMISIFSPNNPRKAYDHQAWWGDGWSGTEYGREIDFSRPFLNQMKELWHEVPDVGLMNINPVNSDYCSITEGNKNCYLVFGGDFNENVLYSTYTFNSKECMDTYWISKSEFNYETVDSTSCSRLLFGRYCDECYNSAFLFNCKNCHDCLGCVNLKNKSYCVFNVQYTKEEYKKKVEELHLESFTGIEAVKARFREHMVRYPRRYARMLQTVNSTGDNLQETKNCRRCFDMLEGGEDSANVWLAYSKLRDCMDVDRAGLNTELCYDCSTLYPASKVFFSRFTFASHDVFYSYNNHNCSYLFGCIGLRDKQYCILNKQYAKDEYDALVPKVIEHMNKMPYVDKAGRIYVYGEFFPIEISPFGYNETVAQEIFPLSKEEALVQGFTWRDPEDRAYAPTKRPSEIPDTIEGVADDICNEIIECAHEGKCSDQCTGAFKIVLSELQFYRYMKLPLPHLCPSCRHYARVRQRNPVQLWARKCNCAGAGATGGKYQNTATHSHGTDPCPNEFETPYAPDRPEIVYCEACYQQEVV